MRRLTNLLFKVTLSSMILTAPAMITGKTNYDGGSTSRHKQGALPYFTATVIKRFVDHPTVIAMSAFAPSNAAMTAAVTGTTAVAVEAGAVASTNELGAESKAAERIAETRNAGIVAGTEVAGSELARTKVAEAAFAASKVAVSKIAEVGVAASNEASANETSSREAESRVAERGAGSKAAVRMTGSKSAELRMVVRQASLIYTAMDLEESGLDAKAFEYAWRGYHNLVKKGIIQKRTILSICDFSQSSRSKRMYVIDVQHKKLLYRTYVAHGQNSGDEFATSFSNDNDSYKSSLGFYITRKTYVGRNGLSLRLDGVDQGYNDQAMKRKIVLHGSSYVGEKYMQDYGNQGTSLGCPALPADVSARIIRTVKDGSCLFIYHPTQQYLDHSTIIHS